MEHLTKQQLILLALLVSFVTSLSTGIVTVSLMDQAPTGVTRTVSQVIERTIQGAMPQNASVADAEAPSERAANAVAKVSQSLVVIKDNDSGDVTGLGIIVSAKGVILTDKSTVRQAGNYDAVFSNGTSVPVSAVQLQSNGDVAFLAPFAGATTTQFTPVALAGMPKLGTTVLALSGTSTPVLLQGLVAETVSTDARSDGSDNAVVATTISGSKLMLGSPVFDQDGNVIGISTRTLVKSDPAEFYPIFQLKAVIPTLK